MGDVVQFEPLQRIEKMREEVKRLKASIEKSEIDSIARAEEEKTEFNFRAESTCKVLKLLKEIMLISGDPADKNAFLKGITSVLIKDER